MQLLAFIAVQNVLAQDFENEENEEAQRGIGSGILDDTTRQEFGPSSVFFTFEDNVRYNQRAYYPIDTLIDDFHRFTFVNKLDNKYQDLGNIGTAMNPYYFTPPDIIGARSGYSVYDPYWVKPAEIKYYNTLSAYSSLGITLGGSNRAVTDISYSRNIDPLWNVGFDFRRLSIDKQIQRSGRGDRNVDNTYYDLYTHYVSKNLKYQLFGNFIRMNHEVNEFGGVNVALTQDPFDDNAPIFLNDARTEELRTNFHLYHEYKFSKLLQVYHSFDKYRQVADFRDDGAIDDPFFDFVEVDTIPVADRSIFRTTTNEVGVKGEAADVFYNFYLKGRDVQLLYRYIDPDTTGIENDLFEEYGGFNIRITIDSTNIVSGFGEYLSSGNFKIGGSLKGTWYDVSLRRVNYQPTFVQRLYRGSHDFWENDFSSVTTDELKGSLKLKLGRLEVIPGASIQRVGSYVYFQEDTLREGQQVLPVQTSGSAQILSPSVKVNFDFAKRFHWMNEIIYTEVTGEEREAFSIPDIFVNSKLYYENILFDGNLELQLGVDFIWRPAYNAPAYDPAIQQFYIQGQDPFEVNAYPLTDIFGNFKINRARLFLKYHNLVQVIRGSGYFTTPFYPGQASVVDFGFQWGFYD